MSFKIHLIIISVIIVVVYLFWQVAGNKPPAPVEVVEPVSKYSITVLHASWGLNCEDRYIERTEEKTDPFAFKPNGSTKKVGEDNVLEAVSALCNGKLKCSVPINEAALGTDPMPACAAKILEVEYRCFVYDRPWKVQSSVKQLDIDCDRPDTP